MPYNLRPRKQNLPGPTSAPKPSEEHPPRKRKSKKTSRSPPGAGVCKRTTRKRKNTTAAAPTGSPNKTIVDRAETLASLIGADEPRPITPENRPQRKRWVHHGDPIHDRALTPKGWTSTEPDLALEYVSCQTILHLRDISSSVSPC